jgi:hypothetical protein
MDTLKKEIDRDKLNRQRLLKETKEMVEGGNQ